MVKLSKRSVLGVQTRVQFQCLPLALFYVDMPLGRDLAVLLMLEDWHLKTC